jgi:hypothetical protein
MNPVDRSVLRGDYCPDLCLRFRRFSYREDLEEHDEDDGQSDQFQGALKRHLPIPPRQAALSRTEALLRMVIQDVRTRAPAVNGALFPARRDASTNPAAAKPIAMSVMPAGSGTEAELSVTLSSEALLLLTESPL